jgi:hypothetical protein
MAVQAYGDKYDGKDKNPVMSVNKTDQQGHGETRKKKGKQIEPERVRAQHVPEDTAEENIRHPLLRVQTVKKREQESADQKRIEQRQRQTRQSDKNKFEKDA